MKSRLLLLALVVSAGVAAVSESEADVVYPARLLLGEVEPGRYEIAFTLPVLEGRKLRAEPQLPPTCHDVTERVVDASPSSFEVRWQVVCEPASLAGEVVLIEGLLGTQTELRVEIATLDGRLHTALVKPSRPGLVVPVPPTPIELALGSAFTGMRRVSRFPELWLLVLAMVFAGSSIRASVGGILGFAAGHVVAQWLAARNGVLVSAHIGPAFALASGLVPALGLARGEDAPRSWLRPPWLAGVLLGAVFGGVRPGSAATEGLSRAEQVASTLFFGLGAAMGLALIAMIAVELRHLLSLRAAPTWRLRMGYLVGVVIVALLLARLVAFFFLPTPIPSAPFELALFAVLLGVALPVLGVGVDVVPDHSSTAAIALSVALGSGLALGFVAFDPEIARLAALGALFLFGVLLCLARPLPSRYVLALATFGALGHGFQTGGVLDQNVSLPVAIAAGAGLVALGLFHASFQWSRRQEPSSKRRVARALGAAVALLALLWRLGDYRLWLDGPLATEAALGLVRIPLLALSFSLLAILLWPRRRRVLRELGIERRATLRHWALLGLAFFVLPVGTLAARNPIFEPEAPEGDDARRIVSQVLWNTYHAFNLADEDALYERLSQSVTGDLVADLYLDSRRRLTVGTREGAEVTVRDVSVVDLRDAEPGASAEEGFLYDCQWVVTARVRHLQHVHHRQNIYNGKLLIRVEGGRFKIANVELTSEDRVVLPWNPNPA